MVAEKRIAMKLQAYTTAITTIILVYRIAHIALSRLMYTLKILHLGPSYDIVLAPRVYLQAILFDDKCRHMVYMQV